MRIMFLIRSLGQGGAERQLVVLAGELLRRGHQVSVAVFYGDGPLRADLQAAGVPVHDLHKGGRWDVVPFLWRLWRLIGRERPHVVHGYMPISDILAGLVCLLSPGTRAVYGVRASDIDLSRYDWLSAAVYGIEARLGRLAKAVICNSQAGRDAVIKRGMAAHLCHVIPNGIDTRRFCLDRAKGDGLRQRWGGDQGPIIGMVARLDPVKGHEVFVQAAARAAQSDPSLRFVCIGGGAAADMERLQAQARDLGVFIQWEDNHRDTPAVYNALDVLVQPSLSEGFSNVLAEGMACGLPCIATDVGDSAAILGGHGILVPPGDAEALAQAILSSPKAPLPQAAAHMEANFSVATLGRRTEEILAAVRSA